MKALIFDFDGVIVSSEEPRFRFLQQIGQRYGVNFSDRDQKIFKGRTTLNVLQELLPKKPELVAKIFMDFKTEYIQQITNYVQPIDFTVNFIRKYQGGLPIAIASMASTDTIERLVSQMEIADKISLIIGRDQVTKHKPDPEIYLKSAANLKIDPELCIAFEDTALGVEAAISAGMLCCAVLNGENDKGDFDGLKIHKFISNEEDIFAAVQG